MNFEPEVRPKRPKTQTIKETKVERRDFIPMAKPETKEFKNR